MRAAARAAGRRAAACALLLSLLAGTRTQTAAAADADAWRKQVLYFTLTDRFAQAPGKTTGTCKLTRWNNGTWSGITSRLDYLQDLGMTSIWITPIVQQAAGTYGGADGYHGYWAGDWTRVDPHYGTEAELQQLLRATKQRGMLTMLDVVANHVGPVGMSFSKIKPFSDASHYHACRAPCDAKCNIPQAAYEAGASNAEAVKICRLSELPDLNQSVPFVRQQLLGLLDRTLTKFPFDGLRIDTLKHVENAFWREYTAAANHFTLGEWYNIDTRIMPGYISGPRPPVNSLLNFPLYYALTDAFARQRDMKQLQQDRALQHSVLGRAGVSKLGNFLDNHDVARFLSLQPDKQLLRNALTWLLLADGIPIIYSGTEQGFTGEEPNGENRNCLWTSGYDQTSALFQTISRLAKFRTSRQLWTVPEVTLAVSRDCYVYARGADVLVVTTNKGSGKGAATCSAVLPKNVTLFDSGPASVQDVLQQPRGGAASQAAAGLSWNAATRRLTVSMPDGAPRVLTSSRGGKTVQELNDSAEQGLAAARGGDDQQAAAIRDRGASTAATVPTSSSSSNSRERGSMLVALAAAAALVLMRV